MDLKSHETASLFCITERGVEFHRVNIRQKLKLRKEEKLPIVLGGCEEPTMFPYLPGMDPRFIRTEELGIRLEIVRGLPISTLPFPMVCSSAPTSSDLTSVLTGVVTRVFGVVDSPQYST